MNTVVAGGELGGRGAGGALGGVLGGMVGGPVGAWIGRGIGQRAGAVAGRAAAAAIASMMEDANEDAKEETSDQDAAVPCEGCAEIPCFNYPKDADEEGRREFERQLKEQEDAINEMSPEDIIENMDDFATNGRPPGDASARRAEGRKWIRERTAELRRGGMSRAEASVRAQEERSGLAALHTPDLIAGGSGAMSGMGDAGVNSSIGSQWGKQGRADKLREAAQRELDQRSSTGKMNISLDICDDGGASRSGEEPSPGQGEPGDDSPGNPPMS